MNVGISCDRWAFAELTHVYEIQPDFGERVEEAFNDMIKRCLPEAEVEAAQWLAAAGGSAPDMVDVPRRRSETDGGSHETEGCNTPS